MTDPKYTQMMAQIEAKMMKASEQPDFVRMIVYGSPGVGKTFFTATAYDVPECREVLIGDADRRTAFVKRHYPEIYILPIESVEDTNALYWYAKQREGTIKTITIDTLTMTQKIFMKRILKDKHTKNPSRYDPDVAQLEDWGKNTEQMRNILLTFRDLKMNVIFVIHSSKDKDESTGQILTNIALTPKLSIDACGLVDIIGYMYTKLENDKTVRYMLTQPLPTINAKSSVEDVLPRVIREPRFQHIWDAITSKVKWKTER